MNTVSIYAISVNLRSFAKERATPLFLSVRHCPINAMRLYYYVCRDCISETHGNTHLSFEEVMTNYKELGCPGFESVRRTRQKIQAILPELGCSPAARRRRNKGVIAYTNYALDKEGKESINTLTEN